MENDEIWNQFETRVKLKRLAEQLADFQKEIENISKIQKNLNEKAYRLRLRISEAEDELNMPAKSWHTSGRSKQSETDYFFPTKADFHKISTRNYDPGNATFFRIHTTQKKK